jgi:hypothetical protein
MDSLKMTGGANLTPKELVAKIEGGDWKWHGIWWKEKKFWSVRVTAL